MPKKVGFTRWYDRNPELSQGVMLMEKAPFLVQLAVSRRIIEHVENERLLRKKEHGLRELGTPKVTGLLKSKTKRRWYDEHPALHRAFNYLYMVEDEHRSELGLKIIIAVKLLERLGEDKGAHIVKHSADAVSKDVFGRQLDDLTDLVTIYHQPFSEAQQPAAAAETDSDKPENGKKSHDMHYEEDKDGLKLRLSELKYI